jgi:hypothetical protein
MLAMMEMYIKKMRVATGVNIIMVPGIRWTGIKRKHKISEHRKARASGDRHRPAIFKIINIMVVVRMVVADFAAAEDSGEAEEDEFVFGDDISYKKGPILSGPFIQIK